MKRRMVLSAPAWPLRGGQGLNLRDMVEASSEEFDLALFTRATYPGVETHEVPASRAAAPFARIPFVRRLRGRHSLLEARAFDRFVAARLPNAAVVQGVTGTCLRTLRAARRSGAVTIVDSITTHVDNLAVHQQRESTAFGLRSPMHPSLHQSILSEYAGADLVRVMSNHSRDMFVERGFPEERLMTVPPVIDLDEFSVARFEDPRFRVTYVGRLEPWKGFQYLVEAYVRLALPDAELVLWSGPGSRPVARYLEEHGRRTPSLVLRPLEIRAVGYAEAYGRTSVLVHPSMADAFGYVVAEAMASGVPVIVTDQTGAAELVRDGVNGYVVPAGSSAAIAERLRHLYDRPELLPKMGAAAREAVGALSRGSFRDRYLEPIGRLLESRGAVSRS